METAECSAFFIIFKPMFRANDIRAGLLQVNGWRQNEDPQEFKIADSLLVSESGKMYQQAHALITLQNIKACSPDFNKILYPDFNPATPYTAGTVCKSNFVLYIAIASSTGIVPGTDVTKWIPFDPFSYWLENKVNDSIQKTVSRFIDEKLAATSGKSLVENKVLFDGAGRIADVDLTTSGIVGFEVIPGRSRSLTVCINKIGLQFSANGIIVMYVFHSSKPEAVKILPCEYTGNGGMQWFNMQDVVLPYISSSNDAGGSWYVCYNTKDLPVGCRPISRSRDWSAKQCESCDQSVAGMNALSRHVEIFPFKAIMVDPDGDGLTTLWDLSTNMYTQYNNHGLNLELSVVCDITDFVLTQKRSFSNVILLQFAADMLKEMCYNPNIRVNRNALLAQRNELIFALDGDTSSMRRNGLMYELDLAYRALNVDTNGIDKVCLPCKNGGLKYRTV
jgi:hypothetical protein